MSPKVAERSVREALIEAAARVLADEGPNALTTRRVAAEVGASTMAVYTHFGGMEELIRAVVWEGFERLANQLGAVAPTADPVADLARLGAAYREHARTDPHLYAVMFGSHSTAKYSPSDEDRVHGISTFLTLVACVQRCIDAGRFTVDDATAASVEIWAAIHGAVTLELGNFLEDLIDPEVLYRRMQLGMTIALGDAPESATRSAKAAFGA